jgi:Na+-translocating ferredoxin:NAD+ oxidoreductase RnfA subunit
MSLHYSLALLYGIFLLQPLMNFGLIPCSSQAMSRDPTGALGYSLTGGLMILGFGSLSWLIHYFVLLPWGLGFLELPVLLLAMWGWHKLIGRIFSGFPLIARNLPLHFLNLAVLASGLLLIHFTPQGIALAMLRCLGIAVGYVLSSLLMSFFRERAESEAVSQTLRGWPAFLLACSAFWIGWQAIASLLPGP